MNKDKHNYIDSRNIYKEKLTSLSTYVNLKH